MKKLIKTCKTPLILSAMLFSLAIPAMAGNDTYSPAIRKVELQDDSSLKITFTVDAESMWFCPGANGKKAGKDIELTFVRAKYDKRPKVDYPMKSAAKEDISQVITIPAPFDAVFIRDGKNLVKIYPPADKK